MDNGKSRGPAFDILVPLERNKRGRIRNPTPSPHKSPPPESRQALDQTLAHENSIPSAWQWITMQPPKTTIFRFYGNFTQWYRNSLNENEGQAGLASSAGLFSLPPWSYKYPDNYCLEHNTLLPVLCSRKEKKTSHIFMWTVKINCREFHISCSLF